jgi:formamidopyrimidine-DNA glycosylase
MPELPEVETITNDLRDLVVGRTIESAEVRDPRLVRYPPVPELEEGLRGQTVRAVDRQAKYILMRLSSGKTFVVQLMLTGQLLLRPPAAPLLKSTRLIIDLDGGEQLRLVDSSHLARVNLLDDAELHIRLPLGELGPEVISDEFTLDIFAGMLKRRRQIKALLLDQRILAGLGNIYVDESLFESRIHPLRAASSLTLEEVERLYRAIRRIVLEAIALRGTTTRSYRDVRGQKGGYQDRLKVVLKTGQPCPGGCGGVVERQWMAGRETFLCPSCQPLTRGLRAEG